MALDTNKSQYIVEIASKEADAQFTTISSNTPAGDVEVTAASRCDLGPPPDGGLRAWMQVIAGNFACFITWGLIASYGIFQSYYTTFLETPTDSDIAWIGTLQIFSLLLVGTFAGRGSDAGYTSMLAGIGSFMIVFGLFMASIATQYYQLLLSQGLCVGLGMGILYMPSLSVVSSYFQKRRPFAVSVVTSGAGLGGVVYPVIAQQLLPKIGFGRTMRVMATVTAFMTIVINLLLRPRIPPRKTGPIIDWGAFKKPSYVFFCIGFFLVYWAVYFSFYFIDNYGYRFTNFTPDESINLLLLTNALGIPGRLLPGIIATKWLGPLNTAVPMASIVAIIIFSWTAVHTQDGIWAFAAAYGFFASAIQSLFAVSAAALTDNLSQMGMQMGTVFSVVAFAALTGGPLAGALIHEDSGKYQNAQIWAGSTMLVAAICLVVARVGCTGFVLMTRK